MRPIFRLIIVAALYFMGWGSVHASDGYQVKGAVGHFQLHSQPVDLPTIKFMDKTGTERSFADFKGKVVLLNFWASWCAPCRVEMPSLNNLQVLLGGDAFEVVAISTDLGGVPKAQKFLEDTKSDKLTLYTDKRSKLFRAMGGRGLPLTVLITPDGKEAGRVFGPAEWDSEDAISLIRHYMPNKELPGDPVLKTEKAPSANNSG